MRTVQESNVRLGGVYSRSLVFVGHGQSIHLICDAIRRNLWDGKVLICVALNDCHNLSVAAGL